MVFVADSQFERMDANIESLWNLQKNLEQQNFDPAPFPFVMQFNKRDLKNLTSIDELTKELLFKPMPYFEAVAHKGIGVVETFRAITKSVYQEMEKTSQQKLINQVKSSTIVDKNSDEESLESVLLKLRDSSPHIRSQGVQALVRLRGYEATPILLEMLPREYNSQVRDKIIEGFSLLKDERTAEALLNILNDECENNYLRMEAAEALSELQDQRAMETLRQLLGSTSELLRNTATKILNRLK